MNPLNFRDLREPAPRTSLPLRLPSAGRRRSAITEVDFRSKPGISEDTSHSCHRLAEVLAGSALFRGYQRAFEDATGLPLTLRAVESLQLAHQDNRRQNGFCALMSQSSRSCSACLNIQQRVCEGVNGGPCTMSCMFGLSETAVGVKVGQEVVAYLQTGQIFFKPPTPQKTERALKQIKQWGLSVDAKEAARRYKATQVFSRSEYHATVRLVQFFADQLSATANQILVQQQTAEPLQIARARQFIEAHYQEDLSLASVAKEVHISTFYFCKRFKRATGLNFTHYLSRLRVEKAKKLLLNRNYRVSEVAYGVGFQSLSCFNSVFKRIVGESPTDYRLHLPAA